MIIATDSKPIQSFFILILLNCVLVFSGKKTLHVYMDYKFATPSDAFPMTAFQGCASITGDCPHHPLS